MVIRLLSAGKSAICGGIGGLIDADYYVDCRIVHNPFRDPQIGHLNGDASEVQTWMVKTNSEFLRAAVRNIELGVETSKSRNSFKRDPLKPFTVCFFCLAGVHRSRAAKNVVGNMLKQRGYQVEVVR